MDDPKAIGSAMAVAPLTTYGAFLANVVAIPIQVKLLRKDEEALNQRLILDAYWVFTWSKPESN